MAWGGDARPGAVKPADSTRTAPAPRRSSSRSNTAAAKGLRKMLPLHSTSTNAGGRLVDEALLLLGRPDRRLGHGQTEDLQRPAGHLAAAALERLEQLGGV